VCASRVAFIDGLYARCKTMDMTRYLKGVESSNRQASAAISTVEGLMYSLRERGTEALNEPDTRRRLAELAEEQMHAVCARLQKLNLGRGAWTPRDIDQLIKQWAARHG
jgi:hypothetical protein